MATKELVWESVCEEGRIARRALDDNRWIIGDLALQVETAWGEGRIADFAREINLAKETVYRYRRMSAFYSESVRNELQAEYNEDVITHTHFREAMKTGELDTALDMLDLAASNLWTTDEMARNMGGGETSRVYLAKDMQATARIHHDGKIVSLVILLSDDFALEAGIERVRVSVWRE